MKSAPSAQEAGFIAGEDVTVGDWFDVLNPSDGRLLTRVARCGAAEVAWAVDAARAAYEGEWSRTSAADRGMICRRIAQRLRGERTSMAELECLDTGKPLSQALVDIDVAARYFDFYGCAVETLGGDTLYSREERLAFTLREPYGVSGHIIPWNYPAQVAARTVAPALAAGNCCVLKPAEDAPLSSLRLARIAREEGLPAGVLSVVPGYGEEAGAALACHPEVDHLSFTGSREVGESVMIAAARNITPVTLELGGKSPHIVLRDADLERAVPLIVDSITEHAGQNCSAGSRLLVHESLHDELVNALGRRFRSMTIGPGMSDPAMGPLISAKQRNTVLDYVQNRRGDAEVTVGGGIPEVPGHAEGFYVEPTILTRVTPKDAVFQQEIFGPVLSVTAFGDLDEAMELAEDTSYGLAAGIWTQDVSVAHWMARRLRTGQVFVNDYGAAGGVELPFGGYKKSGIGVEKGFEGLREYTRCKTVVVHTEL